ncbi:uncharacterized protein JCM6883_000984 [Sporobolomyces salmoneus]|uniref:uncharacterized protein n=1 Tax=Sporobolomyces salmoneus TaxID=183962 RepID=UPI003177C7F3
MFAQSARASSRFVQTPRLARSYAQGGPAGPEPVNRERGPSKTPIFIAAAVAVLAGGYFVGVGATPPTSATQNMAAATTPKTEAGQKAAVRMSLVSSSSES